MKMDSLYYIPKVTITKDLRLQPMIPISIAVIASELKSIGNRTSEYLLMRINAVYQIAIANKHDVIILGAWGLGAFKEDDGDVEILAKHFKQCALAHQSKIRTVFALFGNKSNYNIFKGVIFNPIT